MNWWAAHLTLCAVGVAKRFSSVLTLQIHGLLESPQMLAAWRLDDRLCSLMRGCLGRAMMICTLETRRRVAEGPSPLCSFSRRATIARRAVLQVDILI